MEDPKRNAYWRANIKLMLILLSVWFLVSFGFGILLVDQLNTIQFLVSNSGSGGHSRDQSTSL